MHKKRLALFWGTLLLSCMMHSPAAQAQVTSIVAVPYTTVLHDHDPFQITLTAGKPVGGKYTVKVEVLRNQQPSTSSGILGATVRLLVPGSPASSPQTITIPNPSGSTGTGTGTFPSFTLPANASTVSVEYTGWLSLPHHTQTQIIPLIVVGDQKAAQKGQRALQAFEEAIHLPQYIHHKHRHYHPYRHYDLK